MDQLSKLKLIEMGEKVLEDMEVLNNEIGRAMRIGSHSSLNRGRTLKYSKYRKTDNIKNNFKALSSSIRDFESYLLESPLDMTIKNIEKDILNLSLRNLSLDNFNDRRKLSETRYRLTGLETELKDLLRLLKAL